MALTGGRLIMGQPGLVVIETNAALLRNKGVGVFHILIQVFESDSQVPCTGLKDHQFNALRLQPCEKVIRATFEQSQLAAPANQSIQRAGY